MSNEETKNIKSRLHHRNRNRERYDLEALTTCKPELKQFVEKNIHGVETVDFSNPKVVKLLNQALLHHYFGIENWDFPDENLCPPIPGRADYLHYIADLLAENNFGKIPTGDKVTCLDIGMGANCIYPIIGVVEYDWRFIATDIDQKSIDSAKNIIQSNEILTNKVGCRLQQHSNNTFKGILTKKDKIDVTICNPPFHASSEDAKQSSHRKRKNLSTKSSVSNFSGKHKELVCEGGELQFIQNMIGESETFAKNCLWFTTLVSKQSNVKTICTTLDKAGATEVKIIPMGTGNKSTRIIAWSFLNRAEEDEWREKWGDK
ncbi:MAG: 23S rRNA (adenine(1618)-N(6))-methyltransferase RlmF [Fluviicola sp.]|nr:23S rRNA (adenine(1618)-N(6))-methyltransferase RlmF [Fluviicola sp.]